MPGNINTSYKKRLCLYKEIETKHANEYE